MSLDQTSLQIEEADFIARHSAVLKDWTEWEQKSLSLRRAALVLHRVIDEDWQAERRHRASPPTLQEVNLEPNIAAQRAMLNGMAAESLVKALWVKQRSPFSPEGRYIIGSHNTRQIIKELGIFIHEEEEELLFRLEGYVVWAGKYPLPKTVKGLEPVSLTNGRLAIPGFSMHRLDEETFAAFYDRLRFKLHQDFDASQGKTPSTTSL